MAKMAAVFITTLILSLKWVLVYNYCVQLKYDGLHCSKLDSFPELMFENKLKILIFSHSNLNNLKKENFNEDLSSLQKLNMYHCEISTIENEAFFKLENLESLQLSDNNLMILQDRTFSNLKALENLKLSKNRIKKIEGIVFLDLVSLKILDLSNNLINYIPVDLIINNSHLHYLDISNNLLDRLKSGPLINSTGLQTLFMMNCNITFLPKDTFTALPSLKNLVIANNSIRVLEPGLLHSNKYLIVLNISNNKLSDQGKLCEVLNHRIKDMKNIDFQGNQLSIGKEELLQIMRTPCPETSSNSDILISEEKVTTKIYDDDSDDEKDLNIHSTKQTPSVTDNPIITNTDYEMTTELPLTSPTKLEDDSIDRKIVKETIRKEFSFYRDPVIIIIGILIIILILVLATVICQFKKIFDFLSPFNSSQNGEGKNLLNCTDKQSGVTSTKNTKVTQEIKKKRNKK